jgi:hypothetical protein
MTLWPVDGLCSHSLIFLFKNGNFGRIQGERKVFLRIKVTLKQPTVFSLDLDPFLDGLFICFQVRSKPKLGDFDFETETHELSFNGTTKWMVGSEKKKAKFEWLLNWLTSREKENEFESAN